MENIVHDFRKSLTGFAYASQVEASSVEDLAERIFSLDLPALQKARDFGDYLTRLGELFHEESLRESLGRPLATLLARDIESIESVFVKFRTETLLPPKALERDLHFYCSFLRDLGIDASTPALHFVESFPKPYQNQQHWAMTFDAVDSEQYGIEPGVYFREETLLPFGSTAILSHELTHVLLSKRRSTNLVRGLEEGIADALSFLLLSHRFASNVAINILRNFRFYYPLDTFDYTYLQSLRAVAFLVALWGPGPFMGFVHQAYEKGRHLVVELEHRLLAGDFLEHIPENLPPFQLSEMDSERLARFAAFASTFPYGYVVSPLARYVADFCTEGTSLDSLANSSQLAKGDILEALNELETSLYLVIVDEEKLVASECNLYLRSHGLRYRSDGGE